MGLGRPIVATCALGVSLLLPRAAHASPVLATMCSPAETKCERANLAVSKLEMGPADFDYDTGWVPANSPIQIRLVVALHDRTQVDLAGTLDSTWPDPITLTPKGTPGEGHISIDDGFEVSAQARFTVTVAGNTYQWTGNIPYVPNVNFIATGSQPCDPWAWAPGDLTKCGITAKTPTQKVMQVPLTQAIINIPGISGGFELDGAAEFSAWYDTLRIAFDEVNGQTNIPLVDPTHASTRLLIAASPSFDTNVFIHGEVTRQVTLHFVPAFYFSILGKDFTLPLADLPLPLPASNPEPWDFDPVPVHVPLPEISIPKTMIDVGTIPVDVGTDEYVDIVDIGEEVLAGTVDTLAPMAEIDTPIFSVTPQQTAGIKLLLVPHTPGAFDVMLHLASNDPLTPDSYVHLIGFAGGNNVAEAGGCGCRTAGSREGDTPVVLTMLAGLLALASRRRRQGAEAMRAEIASTSSRDAFRAFSEKP